jgi:hypothetical protein
VVSWAIFNVLLSGFMGNIYEDTIKSNFLIATEAI